MSGATTRHTLCLAAALCGVVLLAAASPAGAVTAADQRTSAAMAGQLSESTPQLAPGDDFAVERTAHDELTVRVNASLVGSQIQDEVRLTVLEESVNWQSAPWNVTASERNNGEYTTTFAPPSGLDSSVSLANATVGLTGTNLTDTAHLHTVSLTDAPLWTNGTGLYAALDGTTGVTNDTAVTVTLGGESVASTVDTDRNLLVVDTAETDIPAQADLKLNVTTDGTRVAEPRPVGPDIRLTDGVVLWHPAIRAGTEYDVTVVSADGETVNETESVESTRTGQVAVPNETTVAAADSVTVSLDGDGPQLDGYAITGVSNSSQVTAGVVDRHTVRFTHSVAPLAVDSVLVENDSGVTYLPANAVSVSGNTLSLSTVPVNSNTTLTLRTAAGILTVDLSSGSPGQSAPPAGTTGEGGGILSLLFPAGLLVPLFGIAAIGGLYVGKAQRDPDLLTAWLLAVIAGCLVALVALVGGWQGVPVVADPLFVGGVIGSVVVGVGGYTAGPLLFRNSKSTGQSSTSTRTLDVVVSDGSGRIRGSSEVTARRRKDDKRVSETITSGSGQLRLPSGTWAIQATHGGYSSDTTTVELDQLYSSDRLRLTIALPDVTVTVRDSEKDSSVPGATVELDAAGQTMTERTDSDGTVSFDPPTGADSVRVTVTHDRYHEAAADYAIGGGVNETVSLDPVKGAFTLTSQIDGVHTGGIDIGVEASDDYLRRLHTTDTTVTTGPDGTHEAQTMVGTYRAKLTPPEPVRGLYRSDPVTFEVTDTGRTEVALDASFTWDLSETQRARVRQLRADLDDVTNKSGIDVTLPRYYASVIETVLDAVEAFPREGHQFVEAEAHPDEITDATLDAAAAAIEMVADAMSTKRNRDLFTACADMDETTVRSRGEFDLETLVGRLNDDQMEVRRTYAARADSISERIDAERGSVSEVAPARAMLEEVGITSRNDHVEEVAATHVAIMLLDAVDELFDHPELTKRLSRTVF